MAVRTNESTQSRSTGTSLGHSTVRTIHVEEYGFMQEIQSAADDRSPHASKVQVPVFFAAVTVTVTGHDGHGDDTFLKSHA
jgi:hypothetical protein